jgi:hypothetical protein
VISTPRRERVPDPAPEPRDEAVAAGVRAADAAALAEIAPRREEIVERLRQI